ncbi:hypothetical protein TPHA_0B01550 [Tetrapisispora phaffii CBS 4417]|uniref:PHD-type domain-containing protein n=1 Tax=Tetrapisispora phaffii (strain ATCC 24235 / CBS 4417 / NBRC 1672 / NRRL Y-8282 / UCD 70-5) TaxID=1071381 RepID=G8BP96_TETPH|nr:hypothetical protein TPHA_0B01550 [Tetrapisispora phaffii CBS 4417]CCE61827.1 hypothetical protein TPHA_0B01550 [Tetrapisispora phaffii CBS 4417]
MSGELKDDGPKLREERNFEEFYDDLTKNTIIPLTLYKDNNDSADDNLNSGDHAEHKDTEKDQVPKVQLKQLIFNGKVTIEPIILNRHRNDIKKTTISINQLDTPKYPKRVARPSKRPRTDSSLHPSINDDSKIAYINKFNDIYSSPNIQPKILKALSSIVPNSNKFNIGYDMDEQDALYLESLNQKLAKGNMTPEIFETTISILEMKWHNLEKHIPPKSLTADINSQDYQRKASQIHYQLYGSDDGTGSIEHACAVCGGGESTQTNAIVFCDGCNLAVHQECYGIIFIPEGQWLCRLCLVSKDRKVDCLFCPSTTGAFKQTDTGSWAHVVCALWLPELYFANLNYMEPIEGMKNINKSRWRLNCYICDQKIGACIQCSNKNCFTAYHVTCAKRSNLYMSFNNIPVSSVAQNQTVNDLTIESFCDKHSPRFWPDCKEGLIKTKRYFKNLMHNNNIIKSTSSNSSNGKIAKHIWRTNRGTPIAPQIFADNLSTFLTVLNFENTNKLSYELCKYWSMKRELKRGAPLVRIFDANSYNLLDITQINQRMEFANLLLRDISSLKHMTGLIKKRIILKDEIDKLDDTLKMSTRFSEYKILKEFFYPKFLNSNHIKVLERNVKNVCFSNFIEKCRSESYDSTGEILQAFELATKEIEEDMTTSRIVDSSIDSLKTLLAELIADIKSKDSSQYLKQDFIVENNKIIGERPWRGPYLMEEEGLSDVEDLSQKDVRILKGLLHN